MNNQEETKIDPLTGGAFEKEVQMYMRYHGLTEAQAREVMSATTHRERDEIFARIVNEEV